MQRLLKELICPRLKGRLLTDVVQIRGDDENWDGFELVLLFKVANEFGSIDPVELGQADVHQDCCDLVVVGFIEAYGVCPVRYDSTLALQAVGERLECYRVVVNVFDDQNLLLPHLLYQLLDLIRLFWAFHLFLLWWDCYR
jgi:hypothetical protein